MQLKGASYLAVSQYCSYDNVGSWFEGIYDVLPHHSTQESYRNERYV